MQRAAATACEGASARIRASTVFRNRLYSAVGGLLAAVLIAGCGVPADTRLRRHFNIESGELTSQTIRDHLLRDLPLGASQEQVCEYLWSHGIGADPYSSYDVQDSNIVCSIRYDPNHVSLSWSEKEYLIRFTTDGENRLMAIEVGEVLTGP
jgi:hypothetical protein